MGSLPHAPLASASVLYLVWQRRGGVVAGRCGCGRFGRCRRRRGRLKRPRRGGHGGRRSGRRGPGGCLRGGYPGSQEEAEDGQCGRRSHVRSPCSINAGYSRRSRRVNRQEDIFRTSRRDRPEIRRETTESDMAEWIETRKDDICNRRQRAPHRMIFGRSKDHARIIASRVFARPGCLEQPSSPVQPSALYPS